jgi:AcrR family transcriptional regulator
VATEGLRERKKRERRKAISDIAMGLFAERGYDAVTVAEIARAADVSEQTVFNYFPAKEDLVFDEDEAMLARLDSYDGVPLVGMAEMITASPALQRRAREMMVANAQALSQAIGEALGVPPDSPRAWSVAGALLGVQLGMFRFVVTELRAGGERAAVVRAVRAEVEQALAQIERGL